MVSPLSRVAPVESPTRAYPEAMTSAWDLDLPLLPNDGLERIEALERAQAVASKTWLARTDLGFAVLHQADVAAILRDRRFESALSKISEMAGVDTTGTKFFENRRRSILSMEGEEHTRLRRLVSPAFTPAAADRHRPTMRRVISELVAPYLSSGTIELQAAVCEPYPIPIICEVLGAPAEDWRLFSDWATGIFKIFNGELERDLPDIDAAATALGAYIAELTEQRRAEPGEDLLSDLIAIESEEGDRLATDELCMLAEAVLMAGTDTTRNQLGCTMAVLAQQPELWEELRADRSLVPRAVEETLRYLGAVRLTVRFASEDITYRDVTFPEGTFVHANLAAANRDPSVFADPDQIDLHTSRAAEQMTFGSGIHRCLGAALARAELQESLDVLLDSFVTVELDGPVAWKPPSFGIWGPASLPLRFTTA